MKILVALNNDFDGNFQRAIEEEYHNSIGNNIEFDKADCIYNLKEQLYSTSYDLLFIDECEETEEIVKEFRNVKVVEVVRDVNSYNNGYDNWIKINVNQFNLDEALKIISNIAHKKNIEITQPINNIIEQVNQSLEFEEYENNIVENDRVEESNVLDEAKAKIEQASLIEEKKEKRKMIIRIIGGVILAAIFIFVIARVVINSNNEGGKEEKNNMAYQNGKDYTDDEENNNDSLDGVDNSSKDSSSDNVVTDSSGHSNSKTHDSNSADKTESKKEGKTTVGTSQGESGSNSSQGSQNVGGVESTDNSQEVNNQGSSSTTNNTQSTSALSEQSDLGKQVMEKINEYREGGGKNTLNYSDNAVARSKSQCESNYENNRSNSAGYNQIALTGTNYGDSNSIVRDLINNNASMFYDQYSSIGVAVFKDSLGYYFVVVTFE